MVSREHSLDGRLLVVPVKVVKFIREEGVDGWEGGIGGFVVRVGLDALPHASEVVVEVFLNP